MANIYRAPSSENYNTTLSNGVSASDTTITLNSVGALQVPTVLVIDRIDANGNVNSTAVWEYVLATAVAGNDVTVTRGRGGSTAQTHSAGAVVEAVMTAEQWEQLRTWVNVVADDNGLLKALVSPVSASRLHTGNLGLHPTWVVSGTVSLVTTSVGKPLVVPVPGNWLSFSAVLRTPVSGASLVLDVNKNNTSIFQAGTRPSILGGGTFVSTASINTTAYVAGDVMSLDIDNGGGTAADLTVTGRGL